ncbi:MAG: type 1 glutamine amidotransferase [Propionibacteriales bacterium]|nr:type 1 glutamine amidotransferase [Propionibacteriales bacterium]
MSTDLTGKKIAFVLTNGVEQIELTSPRGALDQAGATTHIVSPAGDHLTAMQGDWDHADTFTVDVAIDKADASDYDLLVLPGGTLNADTLRIDEDAQRFVQAFFDADKPVAAICHAPWMLAQIGVARGRRLTSYIATKVDLENAGADWVDESVVVDGNLITSRDPDDLDDFNAAIAKALS